MTPALDKLRSVATISVGGVSSWRLAPATPVAAGSPIAPIKNPSTRYWGLISLKNPYGSWAGRFMRRVAPQLF